MGAKLGMHVYYRVSMTIINKKMASGSFLHDYPFTSQTHIHHLTHGGETWYTVFPWKP